MTTTQASSTHSAHGPQAALTIEALGGPTALLSMAGLRLLTDPTFDEPGEYPDAMFTLVKTAAPARSAEDVGAVDAVLLSHDEHADNLDDAGRRYLATAPIVLSTAGAVERLAGTTTSRPAWEGLDLLSPNGTPIRVTWVPAQHGPEWATAFTGEVTGFVLSGAGLPTVYVSGDNSSLDVVRDVAERCGPVDVALLFAGAGVVAPLEAVLTSLERKQPRPRGSSAPGRSSWSIPTAGRTSPKDAPRSRPPSNVPGSASRSWRRGRSLTCEPATPARPRITRRTGCPGSGTDAAPSDGTGRTNRTSGTPTTARKSSSSSTERSTCTTATTVS